MTEPTALVFEERRFSVPQLDALADGLAATLGRRGVTAGQRVALMASNRPEFVAAVLAIWRLGAAAVLISPAWKRDEVDHALALTDPAPRPTRCDNACHTCSAAIPASRDALSPSTPRSSLTGAIRPIR